uniref:Uncharacterized protein n=1 Tax=Solanum aethiopicum TaxID=205524 RepID=A0A7D7G2Y0_SOLAE|nr:hypothetical protein [Solanum aethiopicum]QMQ97693.1 hypothetical protein [Solanum aethiopicum]WMB96793.1 hypothetical protein [Solanum melongena]WMB97015.1 hypothetical protein [Solanum aethiopicum]
MEKEAQRSRTSEEENLLARSKKKKKGLPDDVPEKTDAVMTENEGEVPAENGLPKLSWKDMVTGNLDLHGLSDKDEFGLLTDNKDLITVSSKDSWPCLVTSAKLKESLHL